MLVEKTRHTLRWPRRTRLAHWTVNPLWSAGFTAGAAPPHLLTRALSTMKDHALRVLVALILLSFVHLGCYNRYRISTDELERLQSTFIGATETVQSGEREIAMSATTPIRVVTEDGRRHSISPFNFVLSETQLVSPDYDLLLSRESLVGADVSEFAPGKTIALISTVTLAAVAGFVLLTISAD